MRNKPFRPGMEPEGDIRIRGMNGDGSGQNMQGENAQEARFESSAETRQESGFVPQRGLFERYAGEAIGIGAVCKGECSGDQHPTCQKIPDMENVSRKSRRK